MGCRPHPVPQEGVVVCSWGGGVGVGEHRISVSVLARRHRDGSVFCADYRAQLSMLESIPSRLARLVGSQ